MGRFYFIMECGGIGEWWSFGVVEWWSFGVLGFWGEGSGWVRLFVGRMAEGVWAGCCRWLWLSYGGWLGAREVRALELAITRVRALAACGFREVRIWRFWPGAALGHVRVCPLLHGSCGQTWWLRCSVVARLRPFHGLKREAIRPPRADAGG